MNKCGAHQHWSLVSEKATRGEASTSFTVHGNVNCEYGLVVECMWFFAATAAICSTRVPYLHRHTHTSDAMLIQYDH